MGVRAIFQTTAEEPLKPLRRAPDAEPGPVPAAVGV
jgi:hypothetical protein